MWWARSQPIEHHEKRLLNFKTRPTIPKPEQGKALSRDLPNHVQATRQDSLSFFAHSPNLAPNPGWPAQADRREQHSSTWTNFSVQF
eukprot:1660142-Amphidinium_carterae.1